eukprot:COSAG02_NODE_15362_length_1178_cov_1.671918_1_plen_163_part_00
MTFSLTEPQENGEGGTKVESEKDSPDAESLSDDEPDDEPPSKPVHVPKFMKRSPSADLEDVIPEAVDDQEAVDAQEVPKLVSVKEPAGKQAVTATKKQPEAASKELVSFLNSCGIEDEDLYEAFVAFGVQSQADLSELVEEVGCPYLPQAPTTRHDLQRVLS